MSTDNPTKEEKFSDSMTELWNRKCQLAREIQELVEPFCQKFQLVRDQVEIKCHNGGITIKVTV